MITIHKKTKIIHLIATASIWLVAFLLFSCKSPVSAAGGWIGSGSSTSSGGGGGGGNNTVCKGNDAKYIIDCVGVSWMFYEYVGGESHVAESIKVVPDTRYSISSDCANMHEGAGF